MRKTGGVEKGWVRDAVLESLSKTPSTLTGLARSVGVAKSTVDYHIRNLLEKGIIEIVEANAGRGGMVSNVYSLGSGAVVLMPTATEARRELRHLEDSYAARQLVWESTRHLRVGPEIKPLLYALFLHMFNITRTQHRNLMQSYGRRTGAVAAREFSARGSVSTLTELARWMRANSLGSATIISLPDSQGLLLVIEDCLGSVTHPTRACWFLEGLVEGIVKSRLGRSYKLARVEDPGIPACCIVVARGAMPDAGYMKEALLSMPIRRPPTSGSGGRA